MRKKLLRLALALLLLLALAFALYVGRYYRADETAARALVSSDAVTVSPTDYGWLFDGPAEDRALIFYPGAKVEETAYAPLLHALAAEGLDVCLVKMPFRLAVLGMNRADAVMETASYARWYVGGHSLGGACAADYAAENGEKLDGVILLAAYPTKELDGDLTVVSVYGSSDGVLNRERYEAGKQFADADEFILNGGNHAQFGSYGKQSGDGEAAITADEQIRQTVAAILSSLARP